MSRKFSIIKTIDLGEIDKQIQEYKMLHLFDDDPYIFMNEDTIRAVERELCLDNIVIDNDALADAIKNEKAMHATYTGCKLFINNGLKFGIVEIR